MGHVRDQPVFGRMRSQVEGEAEVTAKNPEAQVCRVVLAFEKKEEPPRSGRESVGSRLGRFPRVDRSYVRFVCDTGLTLDSHADMKLQWNGQSVRHVNEGEVR